MRISAALILIASLLSVPFAKQVFGGQFEDYSAAYNRGDYETAYRLIKALAEEGDFLAQTSLGALYDNGQGVPQDYAEAMKWYRKAAEQGYADAQIRLGFMYATGQGVPQDSAEAMKWYQKAAEQGHVDGQFALALMYSRGMQKDYSEAVKWYRKAAEQGYADAQYNLGALYFNGQGVPQDYIMAHLWFNLASSQFPASEGEKREQALKERDLVASKMTPEQIAEAERLAREWKPKKVGSRRGTLPDDDERDDGENIDPPMEDIARTVHLRDEGKGITSPSVTSSPS